MLNPSTVIESCHSISYQLTPCDQAELYSRYVPWQALIPDMRVMLNVSVEEVFNTQELVLAWG